MTLDQGLLDLSVEHHNLMLHYRAKVAALSRSRAADDDELLDARRDMGYQKLCWLILQHRAVYGDLPEFVADSIEALLDAQAA